jgi:hypothetical protein
MRHGPEFRLIMLETFGRAALQRHRPVLVIENTQRSLSEQGFSRLDSRRGKFCLQGGGEVVILTERDGCRDHYRIPAAAEFGQEEAALPLRRTGAVGGTAQSCRPWGTAE